MVLEKKPILTDFTGFYRCLYSRYTRLLEGAVLIEITDKDVKKYGATQMKRNFAYISNLFRSHNELHQFFCDGEIKSGNIIRFLKLVGSLSRMVFWYIDRQLWGSARLPII